MAARSLRPLDLARAVGLTMAIALLVGACDVSGLETPSPSPTAVAETPTPSPTLPAKPDKLVVGLGYIPSVQFAPFYLADQRGYYRDAALEVTFEHQTDQDLVPLVAQGRNDIGVADGTSVVTARSQGIPIKYITTIYGRFPSVVFALSSSGIKTPADLRGKRIGIPGRYGSSYIMLQALLASAQLTLEDVTLVDFPDYSQGDGVAQGRVEAATGFVNNEPVQLQQRGLEVVVLRVDEITPLPGPGLIASDQTINTNAEAVRRFVAATLRAMKEVADDPKIGLDAAIKVEPTLGADQATKDAQLAILQATIDTWKSPYTLANGLGAIDKAAWSASLDFMKTLPGLVPNPVTVDDLVTVDLLPGS
jgi:putative riboflavin transport system substrate-binding protein